MLHRYLFAPLAALLLLAAAPFAQAQTGSVGIGTTSPDASAALDITSTGKGLLPPRLSQAQRDAIASPATGLTIYNTTTNKLNTWNGTSWDASLSATEQPLNSGIITFFFTGGEQQYTVPPGVRQLLVDARGAEGGNIAGSGSSGGKGARVVALIPVTPGQVLQLNVGGQGTAGCVTYFRFPRGDGGWNGGGSGGDATSYQYGGGGGGASDIRVGPNLTDRILVAGGGGGAGPTNSAGANGGSGGIPIGANGDGSSNGYGGVGGSLTAGGGYGGRLGQGGGSSSGGAGGGGGGGGYYGGGSYQFSGSGGGGGSSLVSSGSSTMTGNFQSGNGSITLTIGPGYQSPTLDGSNFVNVPGDNLGNHVATQNLSLGSSMLVGNGGTTGLRVATGGGVGIGADSPRYPLTVQPSQGTSGRLLDFNNDAGADKYNFSLQSGGLNLSESGVADGRVFVQDGGNVGIGTTTPQATLDVAGSARLGSLTGTGLRMVTADANGALSTLTLPAGSQQLSISGSTISLTGGGSVTVPGDNLGNHTATQPLNLAGFQLVSGGPSGLALSSTGSVGIGTTSPTQKLDVSGNANVSGNSYVGGSVGIGTSTPTQKLDVAGNTNVSGNSYVAGRVGIGTTAPNASAALDVSSTTNGLLPPRMSQLQRDVIASPATGLILYNTTTNKVNAWNGTSWDEALSATQQAASSPAGSTFAYTGTAQTYTVPAGVFSLRVDAAGAQGGNNNGSNVGGTGARVQATLAVTPGEVLTIYVGGAGSTSSPLGSGGAGYNGGGNGISDYNRHGGGGGGASDVRRSAKAPSTSVTDRLLVAGGGGGGGGEGETANSGPGGAGGAPNGGNGGIGYPTFTAGTGATTSTGGNVNGTLGQGGSAPAINLKGAYNAAGGGGGGYYGGGGAPSLGGGGGGSSYVQAVGSSAVTMTGAYQTGNGYVTLTPGQRYAAPVLNGVNFVNVPGTWSMNGSSYYYDNGKVGIGTSSPTQALDVNGGILARANDPVSNQGAYLQWNRSGGQGETWLLNQQGGGPGGIFFGKSDQSNNATEWARFDGNGNLGLGTTPSQKLDVSGNVNVSGNTSVGGSLALRNSTTEKYNWSLTNNGLNLSESNVASGRLFVQDGGNVGIGTTSPIARLHVSGGTQATPIGGNTSYFGPATGLAGPQVPGGNVARATVAYFTGGQLWVNDIIVAGALNTTSDRRIKHVIGLSDRAADLALLQRVRITDYTYIDQHANTNQVVKKVIAQEVAEVLPAAVSRSTQAIPNVYAAATRVSFANDQVTVTLPTAHELPATGGRLRFYTPTNESLDPQVQVVDARTVRFAAAEGYAGGLFVYGKYVDDFLSVDYSALTTLNVSATQELARQVAALQAANAALKAQAAADKAQATATLETFEARLRRLEAGTAQAQR